MISNLDKRPIFCQESNFQPLSSPPYLKNPLLEMLNGRGVLQMTNDQNGCDAAVLHAMRLYFDIVSSKVANVKDKKMSSEMNVSAWECNWNTISKDI